MDCELHILTKSQFSGITKNNPFVDKVFSFQSTTSEVINQLKNEKYDFVIDLQKNRRSFKVRRSLGVPSATFPKLNKEKWILVNFKINKLPDLHIVDRYFEAVKKLNITNDGKGLEYFIPKQEIIDPASIHEGLKNGYVGIVIGGKHNTKVFPAEKVIEIIEQLDIPVVLLGGEEDKKTGDYIKLKTSGKLVCNTCGKYTLNQSASLVKQSGLIITNDTGLMHIAAAFQKPIISIWGNTIPGFGMYPYLPGNEKKSVISEVENLDCRPCSKLGFKKCPKKHFKCMLDQDVDYIVAQARVLIKLV